MKKFSRRSFIPIVGALLVAPSILSFSSKPSTPSFPNKIKPKALKKGDTIGICASAGAIHDVNDITTFIQVLKEHGFEVKEGVNTRTKYGYFSAEDQLRAAEFMDMICDTSIKAIFFTRGGWGCARILPLLDFDLIQKNPKIIMGFSDISSLLNAITAKTGLITFHGPNGNATWNEFSWKSIDEVLSNGNAFLYQTPTIPSIDTPPVTIVSGKAEGELFGGNLSVMTGLLGSEYLPDWTGKILFFEEVLEEPYRIDRMLTQWKLNGVFDQVNGIVLGQFRKCVPEEPEWSFSLMEVLVQHFGNLKIPVYAGFLLGHVKNKHSIPIGAQVVLDADEWTIQLLEPAVIA
jgi:muramoyltetrapeptide carboxypeptidase